MFNLVYKDLKLAIPLFFFLLPILTGALMLIPGWLYLFVLMYFPFISVPNILASYKTNNDLMFSILMPTSRKNIVASRIISFMILELLHIIIAVGYAIIHFRIYDTTWFMFIHPNVAYFGIAFIMFGLFNVILFPLYFKTGYNYGFATISSVGVIMIFGAAVEYVALKNQTISQFLKISEGSLSHIGLLAFGIILFALFSFIAYKISVVRFMKVDV